MKNILHISILVIILNICVNSTLYSNTFEEYKALYDSGNNENRQEALVGFKSLAKKYPRHENIADMEYLIALNEKNYKNSISLLNKLYKKRKNFSKRDELAYSLANRYMLQNGLKEALKLLADIEKSYPYSEYHLPSKLMIGSIHLKLGNNDKAIAKYNEVISLYSLYSNDGSTSTTNRDSENHNTNLKEEHYHNALFGLANSHFAEEEYYLALGTYNRLLEMDKNFDERAFVLYRTAICYEYTNRNEQAITIYKTIVEVYANTQSRTLANQRLMLHEEEAHSDDNSSNGEQSLLESNITTIATISTRENEPLEKPTIYESDNLNVYQFGRFRSMDKCAKMLDIIESLGYNAYIVQNDSIFIVQLDIYDDERNIDELRNRCNRAGIPFFRIDTN